MIRRTREYQYSWVLAQFHVKFTSLVWLCGLYCPDQVYATLRHVAVTHIPTVVARLVSKAQHVTGGAAAAAAATAAPGARQ